MALTTNFNVSPFYDDYDEQKNFHRVLFRPAVPIQARELTQLQTILQDQVSRFGDNIYQQGTIIKGCNFHFDNFYYYVKINDLQVDGQSVLVSSYANGYLKDSSNLTASIVNYTVYASDYSIQTINIVAAGNSYSNSDTVVFTGGGGTGAAANIVTTSSGALRDVVISSGGSGYLTNPNVSITTSTGSAGSLEAFNYIGQVVVANSSYTNAVGIGYAVNVNDGVIYQKGHFVRVEEQTVIVDKYSNLPDGMSLGFVTTESVVNNDVDTSLLDNAQGYSNYTAPGAYRLKLTSNLVAVATANADIDENFFSILQFSNGNITKRKTETEFNSVGSELAKRTREESGNYVTKPFTMYMEENSSNSTHLDLSVSSGVGYVDGYRVELVGAIRVPVKKANTTETIVSQTINTNYGNYVVIDQLFGNFNFSTGAVVNLRDTAATDVTDNFGGDPTSPGSIIGTATVKSLVHLSGIPGTSTCQYKLYLFNIVMIPGKTFSSVMSVQVSGGVADIVLEDSVAVLKETNYDTLIFSSGANAVSYFSNEKFIYRKVDTRSILSSGVVSVPLTGLEEFPYTPSSTLNDTQELDFILIPTANAHSTTSLSGTVTTSGNAVTGSGSSFITELDVGDHIKFSGNNLYYKVTSIANASYFTIAGSTGPALSSNTISYAFPKNVPVRLDRGSANVSIDSTGNTASIFIGNTINSTTSATVYFNSKVDGADAKSKSVVKDVYVKLSTDKLAANTLGPWCIGVPDALKIVGVYVGSSNSYVNTSTNYASSFELIDGQTDNIYGLSYIRKKPGSTLSLSATNNLLVRVDLFTHGTGYYLSTESYPVDDDTTPLPSNKIRTQDIPYYISPKTSKYFNLRDSIDFRPIVANTANASATTVAGATVDPLSTETLTGTLYFPTPNESFEADITYYLNRIDTVVMDPYSRVSIIEGKPGKNPVPPKPNDGTMILGSIYIPPLPSLSPKAAKDSKRPEYSTLIKTDQVRGYTMKDIKQIEDRINKLEYYSLLNTLEKSTTDLVIPSESNTQINRFKNGFFADSFSSYDISNVNSPEYNILIDTRASAARPQLDTSAISLVVNTAASSNVTFTGEYGLLNYTEEVFLSQPIANKVRNLAQGGYEFHGNILLFPKYDDYYDKTKGQVGVTIDLATPLQALAKSINDNVTLKGTNKVEVSTATAWQTVTAPTTASTGLDSRTVTTTTTTNVQTIDVSDVKTNTQVVGDFLTDFGMKPYIRGQAITFAVVGLRPNTRHYVLFDKKDVTQYCRVGTVPKLSDLDSTGYLKSPNFTFTGALGAQIRTDSNGTLIGVFFLPENTFFCGDRELLISDFDGVDLEAALSSAIATFNAFNFYKDSSTLTLSTKTPNRITAVTTTSTSIAQNPETRVIARLPPPPPPQALGGCFVAGTQITMEDGTTKNIEDVLIQKILRMS